MGKLGGDGVGNSFESLEVVDEGSVRGEELNVTTILLHETSISLVDVLPITITKVSRKSSQDKKAWTNCRLSEVNPHFCARRTEARVSRDYECKVRKTNLGDNDLLSSRELVLSSSESLHDDGLVVVLASNRENDLTNVDSRDHSVGLSPRSSHSSLKSIGSGTGQHLVDSDGVEGVHSDSEMEGILSGGLDDVLVGANSGGLESFRGELLVLVGNCARSSAPSKASSDARRTQVTTEREIVNGRLLSSLHTTAGQSPVRSVVEPVERTKSKILDE